MRQYGISVVSLFPWSLGSHGPERSVRMSKKIGSDGIQALPMRGWTYERFPTWSPNVISWEDAWNFGPFIKAVARGLGLMKDPAPTLLDWLLFGQRRSVHFPSLFVMHTPQEVGPQCVLEINPECSVDPQFYVDYAQSLCWDTLHVRRPHRVTGAFMNWRTLIHALPKESIRLIHVHPTLKEVLEFVAGEGETSAMLRFLRKLVAKDVPVILEVAPPLASYNEAVKRLRKLLVTTKVLMGDYG